MKFDDFVFRKKEPRPGLIQCPNCAGKALTDKSKKTIICPVCGYNNIKPKTPCPTCGK